jgi:hypothetical protein
MVRRDPRRGSAADYYYRRALLARHMRCHSGIDLGLFGLPRAWRFGRRRRYDAYERLPLDPVVKLLVILAAAVFLFVCSVPCLILCRLLF